MERALSILQKRERSDVLKKDVKLTREAFLGNVFPVGQPEGGLLVSQELKTPSEKSAEKQRCSSSKSRGSRMSKFPFPHRKFNER